MKFTTKYLVALAVFLAGPSLAQAATIGSFEGGVLEGGWELEAADGPNSMASVNTSAPKATDGDYSLEIDVSNRPAYTLMAKNFWNLPLIETNTTVEFDIYIDALPPEGWAQVFAVVNTANGGWNSGTFAALQPGTNHYSFDYAAVSAGGGWGGVHIGVNSESTLGTVWIDNVQLTTSVPEPSTLMLLGLGAIALSFKRRK